MPRLFTALEIPQALAFPLSLLRGGLPSARWTDPENYHLTLRFIGDVEPRLADEIVAALDRVERPGFSIALRGIAAFGSKKPRSIHAEVEASPALAELQLEIDRICRRLGLPADQRKFLPHVTLARLRQPKPEDVARYLARNAGFRTPPIKVARFGLFSARDSVGGGPYLLEEAFPLGSVHRADEGYGHFESGVLASQYG
ncbi:MAG: RNA 2',3'-cyclic phosphodiesterase [Aurantimonas endophytica]|uniref:RNA 2',3'-cyclic phosphodiesterase n=1 Tax=Aurantimonas endophytica TaxID=1522175 RepID=A0A7W6MQB1_9HYPH|nr:RNA 2',3'-cyclic phosphodiesterase [Aurantimonas endophytica]MBB4003754.1 2'-5' RNA ligase [Aurantimonas endophytica]MCO6404609.1 RNA 2',3'-cyclic phosphodiesterase [Aurantimonas endophytica]